jgi:hypothetical protein
LGLIRQLSTETTLAYSIQNYCQMYGKKLTNFFSTYLYLSQGRLTGVQWWRPRPTLQWKGPIWNSAFISIPNPSIYHSYLPCELRRTEKLRRGTLTLARPQVTWMWHWKVKFLCRFEKYLLDILNQTDLSQLFFLQTKRSHVVDVQL